MNERTRPAIIMTTISPRDPAPRHVVPAVVFASLAPGELRVTLFPGNPHVDGGVPRDLPLEMVPRELRTPNTPLWVELDEHHEILRAWKRDELTADETPRESDSQGIPSRSRADHGRVSNIRRQLRLARWTVLAPTAFLAIGTIILETTPLELTDARLDVAMHLGAIVGTLGVSWLIVLALSGMRRFVVILAILLGAISAAPLLVGGDIGLRYTFSLSPWKTTKILYRHRDHEGEAIVEQSRDVGALGYDRRIVRSTDLTGFLAWSVTLTDAEARRLVATGEWEAVHRELNPYDPKGG